MGYFTYLYKLDINWGYITNPQDPNSPFFSILTSKPLPFGHPPNCHGPKFQFDGTSLLRGPLGRHRKFQGGNGNTWPLPRAFHNTCQGQGGERHDPQIPQYKATGTKKKLQGGNVCIQSSMVVFWNRNHWNQNHIDLRAFLVNVVLWKNVVFCFFYFFGGWLPTKLQ